MTSTGFLDSHEQSLASRLLHMSPDVETLLWGGYDDAERRILVCLPKSYPCEYDHLLSIIRVTIPKGARKLTHRDYLGSVLNLGIERRLIGDILVRDSGADIICLSEIVDFIQNEYRQIGRNEIETRAVSLDEVLIPEQRREIIKDTVPSLRLDNVISSAFRISRGNAVTAIKAGLVSINHIESTKPDARVEAGARLVLKGKGKAILASVGGESKKGRTYIVIERYM